MENYECAVCGKKFPSFQCDGFASESDGKVLECFYGSEYDMDVFTWADASFTGHICDDCIKFLIDHKFFTENPQHKQFVVNYNN